MQRPNEKSAPALIGDLINEVTTLFKKEIQLLRAEVSEKVNRAAVALGMIVGAVVLALVALNVLAAALVAAIQNMGIAPGWAALIVGSVLAIVAYVLLTKGLTDLKASKLSPQKTVRAVERDAELAKEKS
ncbi:MAG: phage holin family protein [Alphaproteobacteria bacterium]